MTPRFIVCRASAGSGKTYTLVRQFIEIAISTPSQLEQRFEHILAITFTNKAANGMKERIMKQLDAIVARQGKADGMVADMAKDLSITAEEVRRRCGILQSAILHHYSKLSICTIDSFVHRIVRTFAYDLHLPLNFEVMIEPQEVLQTSVDQLLSLVGQEGEQSLTRILCAFAESKMEDGHSYNVEQQISELAAEILKEETPPYIAKLEALPLDRFMEIFKRLRDDIRQKEQQFRQEAERFVSACVAQGLQQEDFPGKSNGAFAYMRQIAEGRIELVMKPYAKAKAAYDDGAFGAKQSAALQSVLPLFKETFGGLQQLVKDYNTQRLLLSNLFSIALLGKVSQLKNDYYQENEVVHISEFNKRIAREVANQPTPFIYERIGSRYSNYLIDEFQDTSKMQWSNFLPLLDEAMAHRYEEDSAAVGAQSLVVGDGKQAIYRFRQGDVRQFMQLPKVDEGSLHGQSLQHNAYTYTLEYNYRTRASIVEFNNRFFANLIAANGPFACNAILRQLYYGAPERKEPELWQKPVKQGGYVQVGFYDEEQMLPAILAAIRHQVDDLHYSYGDIMVLARNKDMLAKIGTYLTDNSPQQPIPLVSSESFILSGSRVVLLLQVLLQYLYDQQNKVAAAQALQLLCELAILAIPFQTAIEELRGCQNNLTPMLEKHGIVFNVALLRALSLYDCCEALVRIFRLEGHDTAYVATFLGVVSDFTRRPYADLGALNRYLEEHLDRLSSSTAGSGQAVRLMTIHKAKGLEEKIVILAMPYLRPLGSQHWVEVPESVGEGLPVAYVNAQKDKSSHFDAIFREEEQLSEMDRINLLYVALTRPEEKLLVFCQDKQSKEGRDDISLLRNFVAHDSQCRTADNQLFEVGDDSAKVSQQTDDAKPSGSVLTLTGVSFPQWENRVSIAMQHESLLSPIEDDSRRYGILIHSLMAQILTADDIDRVVGDYCRRHRLTPAQQQAIADRIRAMVQQHAHLFRPGLRVLSEQPMAVGGEMRRPDRIVFASDAVWVVDFKTGAFDPQSHKQYQRQVAAYADALVAMGYSPVRTEILYL